MNLSHLNQEAAPEIYRRYGRGGGGVAQRAFAEKNLPQWSVRQLIKLLNLSYQDKERSLCVYGAAGIGKSSIMKQFAKAAAEKEGRQFVELNKIQSEPREQLIQDPTKYYVFLDLRAGELNPEQAQGIPDVEYGRKTGYLRFMPPDWVKLVSNPKFSGMILLDELNRSDKSILNSLLQLSLDRIVSGNPISPNCMVVAAANMGDEFSGQVNELDPAQMRRFRNGVLVVDPEEWATYARKRGINRYMIDYAMVVPSKNLFGRGYPVNNDIPINPATLEFASKAMNQVEQAYNDLFTKNTPLPEGFTGNIYEDIREAIEGDVGDVYINNFIEWLEMVHAFDWSDLVAKAKAGDLKSRNALNHLKTRQEKGKIDKDKDVGYSAEELTAAKKFALARFIADKGVSKYEEAKAEKDADKAKKLALELRKDLVSLLTGVDDDQASLILKTMAAAIKDNPTVDRLAAVKDWQDLMVPLFQMMHNSPEFAKLQQLMAELNKINPNKLAAPAPASTPAKASKFITPAITEKRSNSFKTFYKTTAS
jgi:hypothetical protein